MQHLTDNCHRTCNKCHHHWRSLGRVRRDPMCAANHMVYHCHVCHGVRTRCRKNSSTPISCDTMSISTRDSSSSTTHDTKILQSESTPAVQRATYTCHTNRTDAPDNLHSNGRAVQPRSAAQRAHRVRPRPPKCDASTLWRQKAKRDALSGRWRARATRTICGGQRRGVLKPSQRRISLVANAYVAQTMKM